MRTSAIETQSFLNKNRFSFGNTGDIRAGKGLVLHGVAIFRKYTLFP